MTIKKVTLKNLIYCYLALPLLCFLLFYLDSAAGMVLSAVFLAVFIYLLISNIKRSKKGGVTEAETDSINIPISLLVTFIVVAIIWSFLGGHGNHYYQSHDWNWRNAVFRDLIYKPWPVVYPAYNKALVYYIGYWLPCAALVKIFGKAFPSIYQSEAAFDIGNQFLWVWTIIGIIIVEILLYIYVNPRNKKYAFFIPGILVFFSGLDIIGVIIRILSEHRVFSLHLEWWTRYLQFSSLTTCLFWVFNQALISWIIILLIIQNNLVRDYVFLGLAGLISGPLPFLGIFIYMIVLALKEVILGVRGKSIKTLLKNIFSIQNLVCIIFYPVLWMYFSSNNAMTAGAERGIRILGFLTIPTMTPEFWGDVLLFLLLEAALYFIFLFFEYYKDINYYITIAVCLISPFFVVGKAYDFTMRFSIPAIIVLAAMTSRVLLGTKPGCSTSSDDNTSNRKHSVKNKVCITALIILFIIGSVTPLTEFMRGLDVTLQTAQIKNVDDSLYSFDQDVDYPNFQTYDYMNNSFYKYFTNVTKEKN